MPTEILTIDPTSAPLELATGADGFYLRDFKSPPPARKTVLATSQDTEGSILVDSEYEPRIINALIRATAESDRPTWYEKLDRLQQKIAKINEQGGVLSRTMLGANQTGYFDLIGDSEADIPWDAVRYGKMMDVDITLNFLAKPFIRGDEVALDSHSETTLPCLIFTEVGLRGDVLGLGRLEIRNDSGADQLTAWWGVRCSSYDPSPTSALFYEAEALTALDQAATAAITGASGAGNNVMRHSSPSTSTWTPILSTDIANLGKMSHRGTYRVLARVYSTFSGGTKPQVKFIYGSGDLIRTTTLNTVTVPTTAQFFTHDFGLVRLGEGPQWTGVFYGLAGTAGDTISIDCLVLVPVDEGFGFAKAVQPPSSMVGLYNTRPASTSVDDATAGVIPWTNPGNAAVEDGLFATCTLGGESAGYPSSAVDYSIGAIGWTDPSTIYVSDNRAAGVTFQPGGGIYTNYLYASGFGLAIPSGATVTGVKANIRYFGNFPSGSGSEHSVSLFKGGAPTGFNHAGYGIPNGWSWRDVGAANDLWGTILTPDDVNSSNFGIGISLAWSGGIWGANMGVDVVGLTVYYSIESHYLKVTGFGFALPSSTVTGISVSIKGYNSGAFKIPYQEKVRIVKGGAIQSTDRGNSQYLPGPNTWNSYGGDNDLWGTSWAYTDINSSTFGVAFTHKVYGDRLYDGYGAGNAIANIDAVKITVFYTTSGGFQATADAVVFANGRSMEINDREVKRQNLGGTFTVDVSYYAGSYLRIPPARQEDRVLQMIIKTSRSGDPMNSPDPVLDDISAQLTYTPRYLMLPELVGIPIPIPPEPEIT